MKSVVWGELKRQKLQQLTSHGFFVSLEERLAFQYPHLRRGQRRGERGGEKGEEKGKRGEEESCSTAAFINMCTCSPRSSSEANRCPSLHINTHDHVCNCTLSHQLQFKHKQICFDDFKCLFYVVNGTLQPHSSCIFNIWVLFGIRIT